MTTTATVLIPAKIAVATNTVQYTATGVTTIIDKFTATNYDSVTRSITVHLVTASDTAGTQNLMKTKTLYAGESYGFPEVVGHVLLPGGFITTQASNATGVNIRASGREIS